MATPWTDDVHEQVVEVVTRLSEAVGDDRVAAVMEVIGVDVDEDIDCLALLGRGSEHANSLNPLELLVFGLVVMRHSLAAAWDREADHYAPETCYDPPPPPQDAWYYIWGGQRYRTCDHIPSHTAIA